MKRIIDKIDEVRSWPEGKRMLAAGATMIAASGIIAVIWFSVVFPNKQLTELNLNQASVSQSQAIPPTAGELPQDMLIPGPAAGLIESFQVVGNFLKKEAAGARQNSYSFFYDIPLRFQRTLQYMSDAIQSEVEQYTPMGRIIISYYQERWHAIVQYLKPITRLLGR